MRSFLGLANYYRRFIKDFAKISKPLYAASAAKEKFYWSQECADSFDELKKYPSTIPVLCFPNINQEMVLDTDASFSTIGGVLSQIQEDGSERVIAYGSRTLSEHEKGYCVTRKELLALRDYMLHFKHYLYGKKFLARTDHKALLFMSQTSKPLSSQFQTWIEDLSGFQYDLQYRKGSEHSNADGISRLSEALCTQCMTKHVGAKTSKSKVKYLNTCSTMDVHHIKHIQREDKIFWKLLFR